MRTGFRQSKKYVVVFIFSILVLAPTAFAFPAGITGPTVTTGCACHGEGSASEEVAIEVIGFPNQWNHSETYQISISANSPVDDMGENQAGFNFEIGGGILATLDNTVQVIDGEATHTESGNDQRSWTLEWTAPARGSKNIHWRVYVNTVNGDTSADGGDLWSIQSDTIRGPPAEVSEDWTDSRSIRMLIAFGASILVATYLPHSGGRLENKGEEE